MTEPLVALSNREGQIGEFKLKMKQLAGLSLDLPKNRMGHAHSAHPLSTALRDVLN